MLDIKNKKPLKIGILAGFIASLCCVGPLILIVLGIGSASTALAIGKQSPYFLALGILVLIAGLAFYYFNDRQRQCSTSEGLQKNYKRSISIFLVSFIAFIAVYYILLYGIVPWLAPIVYKYFYFR